MHKYNRTARPAATAPSQEPNALGDPDSPIDLVHLARQCQGDARLEAELLDLFRRLGPSLVAQASEPQTPLELKATIAHKLRGSALAIGAGRVARAAEAIENLARSTVAGERTDEAQTRADSLAIAALQTAMAEAIALIERLRR